MPASPANYYPDISDPVVAAAELPKKIEALILLSEHLRQECNRIRNTALANRMQVSPSFTAGLSHLQTDLAHMRVELAYMSGKSGAELVEYLKVLQEPWAMISNAEVKS